MKKLVSALLATAMVMGLATMSMAATISYSGRVHFEVNSVDMVSASCDDLWFDVDYATVLGEEGSPWSAGAKLRVKRPDVVEAITNTTTTPATTTDVSGTNAVALEGAGYIKYTAEMFNVSFKTDFDAGVGKDLVDKFPIQWAPGIELNVIPMEGLTATVMVNEASATVGTDHVVSALGKVVYVGEGLEVGGGYLMNPSGTTASADDKSAYNVWGSYKLLDMVTVGAEYSNRTTAGNAENAYLAKVGFAPAEMPIELNARYNYRTNGYFIKDDTGSENFCLADRFWDTTTAAKMVTDGVDGAYLASVDGAFKIDDTLKVGAAVDYTDIKFKDLNGKDVQLGYKAYVSKKIVDGLEAEAGYKSFIDNKIYVGMTATLK